MLQTPSFTTVELVQVVQVAVEEPGNAGEFDNVGTLTIAGLLACN
jgi:hypothetical protein